MSFLRKAKGGTSALGKQARDIATLMYDKMSGADVRDAIAEQSETVTQILVGMHSDLVSQTARLDDIDREVQDCRRSLHTIREALDAEKGQRPASEVHAMPRRGDTASVSPEKYAQVKLLALAALSLSVLAVVLALVK